MRGTPVVRSLQLTLSSELNRWKVSASFVSPIIKDWRRSREKTFRRVLCRNFARPHFEATPKSQNRTVRSAAQLINVPFGNDLSTIRLDGDLSRTQGKRQSYFICARAFKALEVPDGSNVVKKGTMLHYSARVVNVPD